MSFDGNRIMLAAVLKVELPSHTILFVEGGELDFNGDRYTSEDSLYGAIIGVDQFTDGEADESPSGEVTFAPPSAAAAIDLSSPDKQKSPFTATMVSIDRDTNAVLESEVLFSGMVDYTILKGSLKSRDLEMGFITEIERFFDTDKGNLLNSRFHQSVWPGELGLDNTTGVSRPVPWGEEGPRTQTSSSGGSTISVRSPVALF